MIAALPMYDRPENGPSHDALWVLIRDALTEHGVQAPAALNRDIGHVESWGHPDLLLGQICNLPYRAVFNDTVTPIACADYGLPDTPPGHYHSVFVVRAADGPLTPEQAMAGRLAYNDALSHSGWGAAYDWAANRDVTLNPTLSTGAHQASVHAVAQGAADVACIDAVTWRMLEKWDPITQELQVVGRSGSSPGMTFVTAKTNDPAPIHAALQSAVAALAADHRAILGLQGVVTLPEQSYDLPLPPHPEG